MDFVHLHLHSHYSLLDGLSRVGELVEEAKACGMKALTLTDHGALYGAIEFYEKCKAAGIKPIIGVEAYVAPHGIASRGTRSDERPYHLILLAKNNTGYKNLLKLITAAHLEGFYYKPRVDWDLLERYSEGLIATSACLNGEISRAILSDNDEKARESIEHFLRVFGKENFYFEVQYHPTLPEQEKVNRALKAYATEYGVALVATTDCHYLHSEDAEPHDVLLCLQTKTKTTDKDRSLTMMGEDYSFRSFERAVEYFADYPDAMVNTVKVADMCNVEIKLGEIHLPHFDVPEGKTPDAYLRELCLAGVPKKYAPFSGDDWDGGKEAFPDFTPQDVLERLEYELGIITKTGYATYFLIVQDFVNWAKDQGVVVGPGRGSAAGSIVSYLLNITNVDPLRYELLFERFLNPERISMPDVDLDFADTRRDEVIRYVEGKYGKDHVAQIITFGTMAARASIRDVGRVLGMSYGFCDTIAKMIPMFTTLDEALTEVPELKALYESEADAKRVIDTARRLEGVARHSSVHACGVLITKNPLVEHVPLQYASGDDKTIVSQYSLHPVEVLGLLKMDFLGLKNLTILEHAIEIVKKGREVEVDIDHLPLDDKKTFALLQLGNTTGVFQLESAGMKRYLKQLRPTNIEDIIAMVALYRPGPMEYIPDYIAGKHGKKKMTYLHPKLQPILEPTHGVAIYQEQLMRIARDLAGFTLGEADVLRKAVGKKIASLLLEQKKKFVERCVTNGVKETIAKKVFEFIEPFAGYGFNRAHAACYAMIAYQTAYMKANFPTEFMAALLTSEGGDTDRVAILVEECKQMGIEVLAPDINESFKQFTAVMNAGAPRIRFGLLAIKNVGTNVVETIIAERRKNGAYKNLEDFLSRVESKDLNKKSLESLIKSGALDAFGERGNMLFNLEKILVFIRERHEERAGGQSNFFGIAPSLGSVPHLRLLPSPEADKKEKLSWEKELLGLYVSEHPFRAFEGALKGAVVPTASLEKKDGVFVNVAGVVSQMKRIITKKGESMAFVRLEDATGSVEIVIFPRTLRETTGLWQEDRMLIVQGKISEKDDELKIICHKGAELREENAEAIGKLFSQGMTPFEEAVALPKKEKSVAVETPQETPAMVPHICIALPQAFDPKVVQKLKEVCLHNQGQYKVYLKIGDSKRTKKIETNFLIDWNDEFRDRVEGMVGAGSVELFTPS